MDCTKRNFIQLAFRLRDLVMGVKDSHIFRELPGKSKSLPSRGIPTSLKAENKFERIPKDTWNVFEGKGVGELTSSEGVKIQSESFRS